MGYKFVFLIQCHTRQRVSHQMDNDVTPFWNCWRGQKTGPGRTMPGLHLLEKIVEEMEKKINYTKKQIIIVLDNHKIVFQQWFNMNCSYQYFVNVLMGYAMLRTSYRSEGILLTLLSEINIYETTSNICGVWCGAERPAAMSLAVADHLRHLCLSLCCDAWHPGISTIPYRNQLPSGYSLKTLKGYFKELWNHRLRVANRMSRNWHWWCSLHLRRLKQFPVKVPLSICIWGLESYMTAKCCRSS